MTLQVQNKKSNWQRRGKKKLYSEEMLLLMKGNIDSLVQDRTSLSSGLGSVSLPFYIRNTNSGWHLMPGVFYVPFIWQQPYEGNTVIIPILQTWKLTFREVNYLLEVTELMGAGQGGRHVATNSLATVQALILSYYSVPHPFTHSITFLLSCKCSSFSHSGIMS